MLRSALVSDLDLEMVGCLLLLALRWRVLLRSPVTFSIQECLRTYSVSWLLLYCTA